VNDAPAATAAAFAVDEDTPLAGVLSGVDVDGDTLTYAAVTGPAHGTLTVAADGAFTYTPAPNYNGPDAFTFRVNDGTVDSAVATVSVTVRAVNDAPTLAGASFSLPENSPAGTAVGTVTGSDADGDALAYSITAGNTGGAFAVDPATGAITVANPAALNFEATPVFTLTVQVRDPGGLTGTATVRVALTDVPEAAAVTIDIKPGDGRNRINPRSGGRIEVAILSTADFDARSVDVGSLRFGRTGAEDSVSRHPSRGPRVRYEDVNGDGRLDLVVEFETELAGFRPGDTTGVLTGKLLDGTTFTATDDVSVG
jgi:VCBS repeat-containing protein